MLDELEEAFRWYSGPGVKLFTYWRSTTSYRVRIALNLKGIDCELSPVDLLAGEQKDEHYTMLNPGMVVPTLVLDDGTALIQSMAILEWLEEAYPEPALLPRDPVDRAHIRAAALAIATDIHPLNNLRVTSRLKAMGHEAKAVTQWMNQWVECGLRAFDRMIAPTAPFSFSDRPSMADLCLVPQLYNAHRWGVNLAAFPRLLEIEKRCLALPSFRAACPENQPDAVRGN